MNHEILTLRVYQLEGAPEGQRILVDRLWPRGIAKKDLEPFLWAKELTPSTELRKWFGHQPERFQEFSRKYRGELSARPQAQEWVRTVAEALEEGPVLLLYAAKSETINHAAVLKEWLLSQLPQEK
ncbi:MAG: DUF488 family protein [Tissierellia bacterium]|nr:DUF488 family protein [Tissierellia bacterium]